MLWNRKKNSNERYLQAFLFGAGLCIAFFLPFVIYNGGLFIMYGDYNVQQIPFYQIAHEAIRSGNIGWNWLTDLGTNFIGSYSFYLLGSPYFWLSLPFPNWLLPYLMVPLFALKFGTASLTAYAYIRRFTKTSDFALIGGLLYSYSGFMIYNIFFNHFHDVAAFFPLLLIALEEYIVNNRKGVFALTVALSATVNFYFFFGEIVFLLLYFFMRTSGKDFKFSNKKFFWLFFESVAGVGIAALILVPSIFMVMDNPRVNETILGMDMLIHGSPQRYGLLLEALFLPPEMPARPVLFQNANANWSSVAAYFPLFSMVGVIAFVRTRQKHWLKQIIIASGIMALIPVLNSAFSAFNWSYYTRWLYMPILMLALATVLSFEDRRTDIKKGFNITLAVTAVFAIIGLLPAKVDNETKWMGILHKSYAPYYFINVAIALIGLAALYFIILKLKNNQKLYTKFLGGAFCVIMVISAIVSIEFGHLATNPKTDLKQNRNDVVEYGMKNSGNFELDESEFFRIDVTNNGMDNWPMFWKLPTIQAFHSVVPGSVMEFYPKIDVGRAVASRPEATKAGLRSLTSVKYRFSRVTNSATSDISGFTLLNEQNGFRIFENKNFIPMGFTYDKYIDMEAFDAFDKSAAKDKNDRILLKAILLEAEDIEKYGHLFEKLTDLERDTVTDEQMAIDCAKRRRETAYSFETDNKGFSAKTNLSRSNLVFFSVPYEDGWSAYVNNAEAEIIKANVGFMAVLVPEGEAEIRFDYKTPGLSLGLLISLASLLALAGYLLLMRTLAKKKPAEYALNAGAHEKFRDYILEDEKRQAEFEKLKTEIADDSKNSHKNSEDISENISENISEENLNDKK